MNSKFTANFKSKIHKLFYKIQSEISSENLFIKYEFSEASKLSNPNPINLEISIVQSFNFEKIYTREEVLDLFSSKLMLKTLEKIEYSVKRAYKEAKENDKRVGIAIKISSLDKKLEQLKSCSNSNINYHTSWKFMSVKVYNPAYEAFSLLTNEA